MEPKPPTKSALHKSQASVSSNDTKSPHTPRAGPGQPGRIWWNEVSGWRGSPDDSPYRRSDTPENRYAGSPPNKSGENASDGNLGVSPDRKSDSSSESQAVDGRNEVGGGDADVPGPISRRSEPPLFGNLTSQAPQETGKQSRKGAVDFIKRRTTMREGSSAENSDRK